MPSPPRFSARTLQLLRKAARQKRADWLDRNRAEYENLLLSPLKSLAVHLKSELGRAAPGYHFPQKGIGRLKRPAHRVSEAGGHPFRGWVTYSASRPRESRFTHNPNLYLLIDSDDPKEGILIAGGLYMPSSQQLRKIRAAIAEDASPFDRLFASRAFARCFRGGFSDEKIARRVPRGFDPAHPRIDWIRLQAFFVWRPYSRREFAAAGFPDLVARDMSEILRLNELLEKALSGRWPKSRAAALRAKPAGLTDRLLSVGEARRQMDF